MRKIAIIIFISLGFILAFNSCHCRKEIPTVTSTGAEMEIPGEVAYDSALVVMPSYAFSISFISKGQGISISALAKVDALLTSYIEAGYLSLEKYPWGREGEVDYCVKAIAIPPDQESELYSVLRELDEADELVFFRTDGVCEHKR